MKYLGIDYGTKKIGLATSDLDGRFAQPFEIIVNTDTCVQYVADVCRERGVDTIVIGASQDLTGQDNPVMERIRPFAQRLEEVTDCAVVLEPEFYTTAHAARSGIDGVLDASAAALILQSYLDRISQEDHGVSISVERDK